MPELPLLPARFLIAAAGSGPAVPWELPWKIPQRSELPEPALLRADLWFNGVAAL